MSDNGSHADVTTEVYMKTEAQVNMTSVCFLDNYVSLQVQNSKFFAMVDCGADVTCINSEMLQKT